MISLRPYQNVAIEKLRISARLKHRRILLQASTGSGKTIVACEMIRLAISKAKRALFIAHRKEIILQSSQKLDAFGIEHGIIMARPTKSVTIYLQAVGRIMRPAENKTDCVILDHADLTYAHNLVDAPRKWSLHGRIKKKKDGLPVISVHVCEACFFAYSQIEFPDACPECGMETPKYQPPKVRADGELVELTAEKLAWLKAKEKQKAIAEFKAAKTLEQLIELGKQRGYKPGWAYKMDAERKQWKENNSHLMTKFANNQ